MKTYEQFPDLEIVRRIIQGEIELFEIIIRRYNSPLYKVGRSYNYNHEDTQDLMQDTYIDAFTSLSKFENRSTLKTWLIKIMLNNCYKRQQKRSLKNMKIGELNENAIPMFSNYQNTDANKLIINRELNIVIENALQQIPADYRLVFSLRIANGLNVKMIANAIY